MARPGPLVADAALALVLAVLSLVTVETGGGVSEPLAAVSPPPAGLEPGDAWEAEISVPEGSGRVPPLLTIQNTSTGEWKTTRARPTREPGVYSARVSFPDEGVYSYEVHGGFEAALTSVAHPATVTVGEPAVEAPPVRSDADPPPGLLLGLTLLATLPLALRRRRPVAVLVVTLAAAISAIVAYDSFPFIGVLVALYTVAAHVGRPTSVLTAAGTGIALPVLFLETTDIGIWESLAIVALFGAAWLLGDNMRTRRAYLRELEERAARLEREREANARRAAAEEQARIARELHDIIAHNVSVMTVQAAAAGDAFDDHPGRVRDALHAIESTGREALTELRRLLANVRPTGDDAGAFAPQPGLARLEALVEQVQAAGLAVELTAEETPAELPPSVDLSAYRIVQEALTNTLKHAHATRATVVVGHDDGSLTIDVVDDGRGAPPDGAHSGHGIIGMRERAALFGGELEAGPAPGRGFAVHARIPLGDR